jgi:hypothetical protein
MPIRDAASPIEEAAKNRRTSASAGTKDVGRKTIEKAEEKLSHDLSEKALESLKNLCPTEDSSIESVTILTTARKNQ